MIPLGMTPRAAVAALFAHAQPVSKQSDSGRSLPKSISDDQGTKMRESERKVPQDTARPVCT
jgi:hypothetical protein